MGCGQPTIVSDESSQTHQTAPATGQVGPPFRS